MASAMAVTSLQVLHTQALHRARVTHISRDSARRSARLSQPGSAHFVHCAPWTDNKCPWHSHVSSMRFVHTRTPNKSAAKRCRHHASQESAPRSHREHDGDQQPCDQSPPARRRRRVYASRASARRAGTTSGIPGTIRSRSPKETPTHDKLTEQAPLSNSKPGRPSAMRRHSARNKK